MFEKKEYSDGTVAVGSSPLPNLSPRQQTLEDALSDLGDIEAVMGGRNGPSMRLRAFLEQILKEKQA